MFTSKAPDEEEDDQDVGPEAAAAGVAAGVALSAGPTVLSSLTPCLLLLDRQHGGVETLPGLVQVSLPGLECEED